MDKRKIFITHRLPGSYTERLDKSYELVVWKDKEIGRKDLLENVVGAVGLISTLAEKIDEEVMEAAGKGLKVICNYAAINTNIDVEAATKRGVYVTNVHFALTEALAEGIIGLTICLLRRIMEGDRFVRSGKYKGWELGLLVGAGLGNKTMGVVGLGGVGKLTVRLAMALGMKTIYYGKHRNESYEKLYGVSYCSLDKLLKNSDVVSLSVPLTEETRHMIGEKEIKLMKPTAVLINIANGSLVDEQMLIKALKEGWIAGAGLDIYENEDNVPFELRELPNVILTPQIAAATIEARLAMTKMAVESIINVMEGIKPECLVNPEIWRGKID